MQLGREAGYFAGWDADRSVGAAYAPLVQSSATTCTLLASWTGLELAAFVLGARMWCLGGYAVGNNVLSETSDEIL